jgi:hypothetical protein
MEEKDMEDNQKEDLVQQIQKALDQLATTVHNLSPGDVGSTDRVLYPIALARTEIDLIRQAAETAGCE